MAAINPVPQANSLVSDTQAPIVQNFNSISTAFNLNHGDFGAGDEGKHAFLQMPEQTGGGILATAANEAGLYAAVGASSAVTELVFRRENSGTDIAFTEFSGAQNGWTRLPSGLLLKWGSHTFGPTVENTNITVSLAFGPAYTTVYQVILSTGYSSTGVNTNLTTNVENFPFAANQFIFRARKTTGSNPEGTIRFFVIGIE